jgi:hypothetical protein
VLQFGLSGLPVPVITGGKAAINYAKTKNQLRKIKDFVEYSKGK